MIGVLIATHASLSKSLLDATELIAGEQTNVETIGLYHGDSIDEFEKKVMSYLNDLDEGDGVLALVDFYGGSPSNIVMKCMQKKKFPCISGVNMPMVVEALTTREFVTLDELSNNCLNVAKDSFIKIHEIYEKMMCGN